MQQDRLLFGLAAVLAGIAALEFVLAFVYSPALLAIALPFGAAAYLIWYQASGRLREQVESGRAGRYRRAGTEAETGGFGAGPRESFSRSRFGRRAEERRARASRAQAGRERTGRSQAGGARAGGSRAGGARTVRNSGPTPAEAYRVLGLDADADAEEVRRAYRERVKSVHPDRESGDEEEFKRVKEAYEVLDERN